MGKRKTPLILKLRELSGTMYIFPSASEDINLNINNTSNGVALSHYALLNIPTLTRTQMLCGYNEAENDRLPDGNALMLASLQNYMMNLETLLLNNDLYNFQDFNTVTERVFWKWFLKITGVNLINDNSVIVGTDGNEYYKNTAVTCFGKIDAENHLSTEFSMFNETYINVPTSYGGGPVYMKKRTNNLLNDGARFAIESNTYLEGRSNTNNLNISYTDFHDIPYLDSYSDNYYIFSDNDLLEVVKDTTSINHAINGELNKTVQINTFDDINVDVNQLLTKNNNSIVKNEFNFNAILLYYTIYDLNDSVKHAEAINLFGIIFLDGLKAANNTSDRDDYIIHPFVKRKSTATNFGNSFSFRVNMKTLSTYDNTDAVIQDNTTMSSINSVDFSEVISLLNRAINIMNTNVQTTTSIQDEYAKIKSTYNDQSEKLERLTSQLDAYINGNKSDALQVITITADNVLKTLPENSASTEISNDRKQEILNIDLTKYPDLIKVDSEYPNKLYIDSENELFNKTTESNGPFEYMLGYSSDNKPLLDYTEFIPYIMLKLQEHDNELLNKFDITNIENNNVTTNSLFVKNNAEIKNLKVSNTIVIGDTEETNLKDVIDFINNFGMFQTQLDNLTSWKSNNESFINLLKSINSDNRLETFFSNDEDSLYTKVTYLTQNPQYQRINTLIDYDRYNRIYNLSSEDFYKTGVKTYDYANPLAEPDLIEASMPLYVDSFVNSAAFAECFHCDEVSWQVVGKFATVHFSCMRIFDRAFYDTWSLQIGDLYGIGYKLPVRPKNYNVIDESTSLTFTNRNHEPAVLYVSDGWIVLFLLNGEPLNSLEYSDGVSFTITYEIDQSVNTESSNNLSYNMSISTASGNNNLNIEGDLFMSNNNGEINLNIDGDLSISNGYLNIN